MGVQARSLKIMDNVSRAKDNPNIMIIIITLK